jgi:hypothetical protein
VNVIALTVFVSILLASVFLLLWIVAVCTRHEFSERDALLPLQDDAKEIPPVIEKLSTKP